MTFGIAAATRTDAAAVATVLAEAFEDDPVMTWLLPDDDQRRTRLRRLFGIQLRTEYLHGANTDCATSTNGILAAAMWGRPPGRNVPSVLAQLRTLPGYWRTFGHGMGAAGRLYRTVLEEHPREPHWYLSTIGTRPAARGLGVGTALLEPRLARCDEVGLAAYLESSKEANIGFYESVGFTVTGTIRIPNGPTLWPMWRRPGV
jgi:ribosomal protein S18 acetylase RimI-like enzyme